MPNIMPGFDREIAKLAQRLLINGRPIDYYTNVIASKVTPGEAGGGRSLAGGRLEATLLGWCLGSRRLGAGAEPHLPPAVHVWRP